MPKAQVISLINMKGGVGKTTCAVNLATYLAKDHGKRVLLVDFDPQTNASLSVMPEKAWEDWQEEHGTMADVLEFQIRCLGIIFTRVRGWLRYHAETMERLRDDKSLKRLHFFDTVIPENIKLAEAPMEAKPIALHDAGATGAEAFKVLTAEFLSRLGK